MNYRRPLPRKDQSSKADKRSDAEDLVAAFLAKGGAIKEMPSVEATAFACKNCGHTGIIGMAPGKKVRCPKCREPL
jgi:predicted nucleic-acid-binding Zn-ribbon protein